MVCDAGETAADFAIKSKVVSVRFYFDMQVLIGCGGTKLYHIHRYEHSSIAFANPAQFASLLTRVGKAQVGCSTATAAETGGVPLFKREENASRVSCLCFFSMVPSDPVFGSIVIIYCVYFLFLNKSNYF